MATDGDHGHAPRERHTTRPASPPFLRSGTPNCSGEPHHAVDGIDLPDFAAFPMLDSDDGRAALRRPYDTYLDLAAQHTVGFVIDTPTWRASLDWGARLGYDPSRIAAINRRAVEFVTAITGRRPRLQRVVKGVIGPRGDGYVVGSTMSAAEAAAYHGCRHGPSQKPEPTSSAPSR